MTVNRQPALWLVIPACATLVACGADAPLGPSSILPGPAASMPSVPGDASSSLGASALDTEEECARTAGFWCQVQSMPGRSGREHPQLTATELDQIATAAAGLLAGVPGLGSAAEVKAAVCTSARGRNQQQANLLRQLATLGLNLAANDLGLVDPPGSGLDEGGGLGVDYLGTTLASIGDALATAKTVAANPLATEDEREALKDILDQINSNEAGACGSGGGEGDPEAVGDDDAVADGGGVSTTAEIVVCHIPPGNRNAAHFITILEDAWPAHERHGDVKAPTPCPPAG